LNQPASFARALVKNAFPARGVEASIFHGNHLPRSHSSEVRPGRNEKSREHAFRTERAQTPKVGSTAPEDPASKRFLSAGGPFFRILSSPGRISGDEAAIERGLREKAEELQESGAEIYSKA